MKNDAGRYTAFRALEAAEKKLFEDTPLPIGVNHTPLAVATQVVAGTNYAFFCESTIVGPSAIPYNTLVIINKPISGEPVVMEIRQIELI